MKADFCKEEFALYMINEKNKKVICKYVIE